MKDNGIDEIEIGNSQLNSQLFRDPQSGVFIGRLIRVTAVTGRSCGNMSFFLPSNAAFGVAVAEG